MKTIYILLPVHNRKEFTLKFLNMLSRQTYQSYQLILIDDGSNDGTENISANDINSLVTIKGNGKKWWAGSLNLGIKWLKENHVGDDDFILIINNDVKIKDDFLEKGISILENRKKTLLLAQLFEPEKNIIKESATNVKFSNLVITPAKNKDEINCLSTRGLYMRWKDMKDLGLFHEILLPHYGSDYEYTIRAYKKGYSLITDKNLYLELNHESTGYRSLEKNGLITNIKILFNTRCVLNPVYRTTFVILICPLKFIIPNIFKVWYIAMRELIYKSYPIYKFVPN